MSFFKLEEFACPCGECEGISDPAALELVCLIDELDCLRGELGAPIIVDSGYRCAAHNKAVGGKIDSQHLLGKAADIRTNVMGADELANFIEARITNGKLRNGGLGRYKSFVHYDIGPSGRRWHG